MPDTQKAYQLKVSIRGLSPMVWRRFLVEGSCSLEMLHKIIQASLDWEDTYMHSFHIHGRDYDGEGGVYPSRDTDLQSLKLHPNERFSYNYNFYANWIFDIRLEKMTDSPKGKYLPRCLAGKGESPPEEGYEEYDFFNPEDFSIRDAETDKIIKAAKLIEQSVSGVQAALQLEDDAEKMAAIKKIISNPALLESKETLEEASKNLKLSGFSIKALNTKLKALAQDVSQVAS